MKLRSWIISDNHQQMAPLGVVSVEGGDQWGQVTPLGGSNTDGPGAGSDTPQPHLLSPVSQEPDDRLTDGDRHSEQAGLLVEGFRDDSFKHQAKIQEQDPGCRGVAVCSAVPCWLHHFRICFPCRWTAEASEPVKVVHHQSLKGFHDHRHQGDGPVVIQSCNRGLLGGQDDGEVFQSRRALHVAPGRF